MFTNPPIRHTQRPSYLPTIHTHGAVYIIGPTHCIDLHVLIYSHYTYNYIETCLPITVRFCYCSIICGISYFRPARGSSATVGLLCDRSTLRQGQLMAFLLYSAMVVWLSYFRQGQLMTVLLLFYDLFTLTFQTSAAHWLKFCYSSMIICLVFQTRAAYGSSATVLWSLHSRISDKGSSLKFCYSSMIFYSRIPNKSSLWQFCYCSCSRSSSSNFVTPSQTDRFALFVLYQAYVRSLIILFLSRFSIRVRARSIKHRPLKVWASSLVE